MNNESKEPTMSGSAKRKGLGTLMEFIGMIIPRLPRIPLSWIKFYLGPTGGEELKKRLASAFKLNPYFCEVGSFPVVVPLGYNHDTAMADFYQKHRDKFFHYDTDANDPNFSNTTTRLVPGRTFRVKMFSVQSNYAAHSSDFLELISQHNGVLTGAQGLTLALDQGMEYLRKREGKCFLSFDSRDNLPELGGEHRLPCVGAGSAMNEGKFGMILSFFKKTWDKNDIVLCFCDEDWS